MNSVKQWDIDEIKEANENAGRYFFSPDTMRFFESEIDEEVFQGAGGIYFCTSEQPPHGPRVFKVRRFNPDNGDVWSASSEWFKSLGDAKEIAEELANG